MTWEEAVKALRSKPENAKVILENYFDEDIDNAIERYRLSEEFSAVLKYVPSKAHTLLDIGAGRGMAAYGFAKHGMKVTALEPDPSNDVGGGAIRDIAARHNLPIEVVKTFGESLPFGDETFDVVFVRQVLHHANDLAVFCSEVNRVLKPGGVFIAIREHVLSKDSDLQIFLDKHLLHHLYGGEHAYTLDFYLSCIEKGGLTVKDVIHPYENVINYAPISIAEMKGNFSRRLSGLVGKRLAGIFVDMPMIYRMLANMKAKLDQSPGRLYSFICIKPID